MKRARVTTTPGYTIKPGYSVHAIPKHFKDRILCDPSHVATEVQTTDEPVNCAFCLEVIADLSTAA